MSKPNSQNYNTKAVESKCTKGRWQKYHFTDSSLRHLHSEATAPTPTSTNGRKSHNESVNKQNERSRLSTSACNIPSFIMIRQDQLEQKSGPNRNSNSTANRFHLRFAVTILFICLFGSTIRDHNGSPGASRIRSIGLDLLDKLKSLRNLSKDNVLSIQPGGGSSANKDCLSECLDVRI